MFNILRNLSYRAPPERTENSQKWNAHRTRNIIFPIKVPFLASRIIKIIRNDAGNVKRESSREEGEKDIPMRGGKAICVWCCLLFTMMIVLSQFWATFSLLAFH